MLPVCSPRCLQSSARLESESYFCLEGLVLDSGSVRVNAQSRLGTILLFLVKLTFVALAITMQPALVSIFCLAMERFGGSVGLASTLFAGGPSVLQARVFMDNLRSRLRLFVARYHFLSSSFADECIWKLRKYHSYLKAFCFGK